MPLTPVASLEARTVIHNLLNSDNKEPDYTGTASVLYTFPPVAKVGMLERDAKKANIDYQINYKDTSNGFSTKRLGFKKSAYKVIINKTDSKIIGAHLLGHHVDEVINIFALAIRNGFTVDKLKDNLWSFPSVSDGIDDMLDIKEKKEKGVEMKQDKDIFLEKIQTKLKNLENDLEKLKDNPESSEKQEKEKYEEEMNKILEKKSQLKEKLYELKNSGESKWSNLSSTFEDNLQKIETAFSNFKKKFNV